jgi:sec-independent protein translocase protein TatB
MFDIGFSELLVIGVVALIVIGPQKLPRVARTAGHLLGRLQRYVADVKADINREIELEELRKMRDSMQSAASEVQSAVDSELSKTAEELNKAVAPPPPAPAPAARPSAEPDKPQEQKPA